MSMWAKWNVTPPPLKAPAPSSHPRLNLRWIPGAHRQSVTWFLLIHVHIRCVFSPLTTGTLLQALMRMPVLGCCRSVLIDLPAPSFPSPLQSVLSSGQLQLPKCHWSGTEKHATENSVWRFLTCSLQWLLSTLYLHRCFIGLLQPMLQ